MRTGDRLGNALGIKMQPPQRMPAALKKMGIKTQ
jgi:hypothetical protein